MPRKKKEAIIDFESEFIKGIADATERAGLEDLSLKFTPEEINLPEPIDARKPLMDEALQAAGTVKKSKPRYVRGDKFYLYLDQRRVKGKWRGAGQFMKITGETKTIERTLLDEDGYEFVEQIEVQIRKQSKPSKAWLARHKDAA